MAKKSALKSVRMIEVLGRISEKLNAYLEDGKPIPIAFESVAESALPWLEKLEMMVDAADNVHTAIGPIKGLLDHLKKNRR